MSSGRSSIGREAPYWTMLVLSVDGLMPNQVFEADTVGLAIPNLRRMVHEGAFATGVRGVVPAVTYPAHTTLLTGTSPATHGVLMNETFDPMRQNHGGWYWYAQDIRVMTLWGAATAAGLVSGNVCWPVSVRAPVDYNVVQYWRGAPSEDRKLYDALSTPGLLGEMQSVLGPLPHGEDYSIEADETRARFVEFLIHRQRPSLTTGYLGSLDEIEHRVGPADPLAFRVLERLDGVVGRLRAALESLSPTRFIFAVVSDHGFASYTREIHLGALLAERGLIRIGAESRVESWTAAAWIAGGTAALRLRDPHDRAAQSAVARLVTELQVGPEYGVLRVFHGAELDSLGGFTGADYVLALRPGFKFGKNLSGPVCLDKAGGTHGYLPDEPGMDAAFFLVGPGVPAAHSLGRIDMRDVAPTLASLLGLSLPAAEGKVLLRSRSDSALNPDRVGESSTGSVPRSGPP